MSNKRSPELTPPLPLAHLCSRASVACHSPCRDQNCPPSSYPPHRCSFDGKAGLYDLHVLALGPNNGAWRLPKTLLVVGRRCAARDDLPSASALLATAHEQEGKAASPCCRCFCPAARQSRLPAPISNEAQLRSILPYGPATALRQHTESMPTLPPLAMPQAAGPLGARTQGPRLLSSSLLLCARRWRALLGLSGWPR